MYSAAALLISGLLAATPISVDQTGAVWLHDDSYVSKGVAHSYVDVQCPRGQRGWTLTVRLTAVATGRPTATGSTTTNVTCDGEDRWRQHPVDVRPDAAPFFAGHDARNEGVAELRDPTGTLAGAVTRRMHFYPWD
ncbi:hypothetical protein [Nocardia sp. NPDC049149]|uniref:hypothetical protein n=1 Tax=Nocardia sp. NPDC049149 TaxID=3364315 RepID=UPI0037176E1E